MNGLWEEYQQAAAWVQRPADAVHLVGIGGIGMAGLALLLRARGFPVSGCDRAATALTETLRASGIPVSIGHDPAHCAEPVRWLIRSAAVAPDDPELAAARAAGMPVFRRGAVLPALLRGRRFIAVGGTHGKTTTTGWIAQILRAGGGRSGFCVGGEIPVLDAVAADDGGDAVVVAEADESDGTLALYEPRTAVVTNIDFDHQENFPDPAAFEACFQCFIDRAQERLVYGRDDPVATRLAASRPRAVSFGFHDASDYHGRVIDRGPGWTRFALTVRGVPAGEIRLPAPGLHNVLNALAAIAVAAEHGLSLEIIRATLAAVERPRRRFETLIECGGRRVLSDYAHHPTELNALMLTARGERCRRLVTVFQPHRYSRTKALGAAFPGAFEGADPLILLPVYAASESPVDGGRMIDLYQRFREQVPRQPVWMADSVEQVEHWLHMMSRPGDLILIAGAGNVETAGLNLARRWRQAPPPPAGVAAGWREALLNHAALQPDQVSANHPLAARTTLGVGGPADLMVRVRTEPELAAVLEWTAASGLPLHILGGGSNLLVSDLGVRGVAVRLDGPFFQRVTREPDGGLAIGAATPLARLAALSRSGAASGFGFLQGIPGTVGGAVRMNAGAWGVSMADRVIRLAGVDRDGRSWIRERDALEFGYRRGPDGGGGVVTAVWLRPGARDAEEPLRMREQGRRRAWMRGRRTAGSVFRNPDPVAAGALLDAAGCKGLRIGGARVCREHANVIACGPAAQASDVLALIERMREAVRRHSGIVLELEMVVWS